MELQGLHKVGKIEERGEKKFLVAKITLDRKSIFQGQEYANFTEVTLQGKKTELIEERNIAPGDFVKVTGDLQGRFFQHEGAEKFAQDFVAWNIEVVKKKIAEDAPKPTTDEAPY